MLDATANPDTVRALHARWPDSNWAVACGRTSGIVVIDIDPRKDGFNSFDEYERLRYDPLPETLRANTGGAGQHLFYGYPSNVAIKNRNGWLPGVDIKSDGGYVIIPPASHISGASYSWANWGTPLEPLPLDVAQDLVAGGDRSTYSGGLDETDNILEGVPEGERDDVLFRLACRLWRQTKSKHAVEAAILRAASRCSPPFPEDQALKCCASAFNQDHSDSYVEWQTPGGGDVHECTDQGNMERFVEHYGERVRYVSELGWLTWTDAGWECDTTGEIDRLTLRMRDIIRDEAKQLEDAGRDKKEVAAYTRWATASQSERTLSAMLKMARNSPEIRLPIGMFDADDSVIACRNGIVNLRTGELRQINRDDLVTKTTGVEFDLSYVLPEWEAFILQVCNGDQSIVDYVQRAAGYTLTGAVNEEVFFIISGPPASGKSTFLTALHAAMGTYATSTQAETFMYRRNQSPPPNELARLAGMRLVSMSEVREGEAFAESAVKQFTGGDLVTARHLYQHTFEFQPKLKLWIGTNYDPDAKDDALWRRIKKIPFPHPIPPAQRDQRLKQLLRDPGRGARAVLAWAVRGAMQWYEQGLNEPLSITMEVQKYYEEQDRFGQFIHEVTRPAQGATLTLNELFVAYRIWCTYTGETPRKQVPFKRMMASHGYPCRVDDQHKPVFDNLACLSSTFAPTGGVTWQ